MNEIKSKDWIWEPLSGPIKGPKEDPFQPPADVSDDRFFTTEIPNDLISRNFFFKPIEEKESPSDTALQDRVNTITTSSKKPPLFSEWGVDEYLFNPVAEADKDTFFLDDFPFDFEENNQNCFDALDIQASPLEKTPPRFPVENLRAGIKKSADDEDLRQAPKKIRGPYKKKNASFLSPREKVITKPRGPYKKKNTPSLLSLNRSDELTTSLGIPIELLGKLHTQCYGDISAISREILIKYPKLKNSNIPTHCRYHINKWTRSQDTTRELAAFLNGKKNTIEDVPLFSFHGISLKVIAELYVKHNGFTSRIVDELVLLNQFNFIIKDKIHAHIVDLIRRLEKENRSTPESTFFLNFIENPH
jgi:hypothetical protein